MYHFPVAIWITGAAEPPVDLVQLSQEVGTWPRGDSNPGLWIRNLSTFCVILISPNGIFAVYEAKVSNSALENLVMP